MKKHQKALLKTIIGGILSLLFCFVGMTGVYADGRFTVSPMNQKIILTPGETYRGTFKVSNPGSNKNNFTYKAEAVPFYVSEDYEPIYENNGDYTQMAEWIKIENPEGMIMPNNVIELKFSIDVPMGAPAGGQYAAITIASDKNDVIVENALNIDAKYSIAHIIYAEVAGTTKRGGEIVDADVSSFLLSGNITGRSTVKNTGNVHDTAKYTLQIFPLFSGEEVYTNEEDPIEKTILPDRSLYNELAWEDTPAVGVFNVVYTVEFAGMTAQVSKMVIKCPIWLLFIIIFVIFALIFYFVARAKVRKKAATKAEKTA
ncbi:hypothetical protein IIY68_00470 [Candidatus Saccharibacteria bacterium]|nr:hypothetical protein [Candidatus Saccharibacteria bacterium]